MERKIKCANPKAVITLNFLEVIDIYNALAAYDENEKDKDAYTVLRDEFFTLMSIFEEMDRGV